MLCVNVKSSKGYLNGARRKNNTKIPIGDLTLKVVSLSYRFVLNMITVESMKERKQCFISHLRMSL